MTENQTPGSASLLIALLTALNTHIEKIVDARIAAAFQAKDTLALMDDSLEHKMRQIATEVANDAIDTHELNSDHPNDDHINDEIASYLNHNDYVNENRLNAVVGDIVEEKMSDGDYITTDDVDDKLSEYVQEDDVEDKMKAMLANLTVQLVLTPRNKEE